MKVNCDILRYFLSRQQWHTAFFQYDSAVLVDSIRYLDAGCSQEHTLFLLELPASSTGSSACAAGNCLPELPSLPVLPSLPDRSCILLCILPPDWQEDAPCSSQLLAALSCPIICVYTDRRPALLNAIHDIFETIYEHHQALEQLCLTSHSYQALIDCCDDLLEEPVSLIDNTYTYVAYSMEKSRQRGYIRTLVENGRVASQTVAQLMSTPGFELLEEKRGVFEFEDENLFMGRNIFYDDTYVGRLIAMPTQDFIQNSYLRYILECLGGYVEQMYRHEGSFFFREEQPLLLHTLVPSALAGEPVKASDWRKALEQKGWSIADSCRLMTFQASYRHEKNLHPDYLCPQLESRWPWIIAAIYSGNAVVLINWDHIPGDFEQQLAYFIRDNLLIAGISRSFRDSSCLEPAYRQAQIAITLGLRNAPHLWYYFFDRYALDYLQEQCLAELPAKSLCHPALVLLAEYDEQHGTELYRSLYTFLDSRYNMSRAAGRMYVHRTTFIKRMEHIEQLTGLDLTDWETRMYLMLSYQWME